MKKNRFYQINLQRFAATSILDLFNQKEVLDYTRNRELPVLLGETLFPARKTQSLELEQITGGGSLPIIASVHAFDTESEIGSRQASKATLELALIKRKMQLKEKDIIALENPRTPAEQQYLMSQVYNDIDVLVRGVNARTELMRMEVLANGKITLNENGLNATVDYNVPADHKEALTGTSMWTDTLAKPLEDIDRWSEAMDTTPTRVLTSKKILNALLRHPQVKASVFGSDTGKVLTRAELDAFMQSNGMPVIRTYDEKYRKQNK
ncbi:MAG: major capsid protein, partial [Carnobacterium inhibens]